MGVTLKELCERAEQSYEIKVIAGEKGLNNIIQWVHTVEDKEASQFLHGGELVFTTGIGQAGVQWLLPFAKSLKLHRASGLVINTGPYIKVVDQGLIDYCNELDFPLLTVPWKTRLVDITRDFCNRIIKSEELEQSIAVTLKNMIFYPDEVDPALIVLDRHGYDLSVSCRALSLAISQDSDKKLSTREYRQIKNQIDSFFYESNRRFAKFEYDGQLICIVFDYNEKELQNIRKKILNLNLFSKKMNLRLVIGPKLKNIRELPKKYRQTTALMKLAAKQKKEYLIYEEIGVQKILLGVNDLDILDDYVDEQLGRIIKHDREDKTNYLQVLKLYLEYNGSVQQVAELLYVHRNTINYQLNQIKKLINKDLTSLETRFELMIALKIFDYI